MQVHQAASDFAQHLGKSVCNSLDRPGFIVNRVLMPMINEAFYALMEVITSDMQANNARLLVVLRIILACVPNTKLLCCQALPLCNMHHMLASF